MALPRTANRTAHIKRSAVRLDSYGELLQLYEGSHTILPEHMTASREPAPLQLQRTQLLAVVALVKNGALA